MENTDPAVKMKFSASSGSNKSKLGHKADIFREALYLFSLGFLGKISMASCKQDSKNLVLYFYKIEKFSPIEAMGLA